MTSGGGTLDIFGRIRSLLNSFGFPSKDNSLKRRAPDQNEYSSLAKYRRVSNAYPHVTPRTFEVEDRNFLQRRYVDASADTADRGLFHHKRTNMSLPMTTPRANLNTYADLEYSDDDDVIFTNPRHRTVVNSTPSSTGLNSLSTKNVANIIFPDHIPVIVRNAKPSAPLNSSSIDRRPKPITLNGNLPDVPPLLRAFNNNHRQTSGSKSDSHDTWHKRLSAKPSREPIKPIPALIEAKTGRLAASSIPIDYAGNFGAARNYMNGIDDSKDTKLTNGVMSDSYSKGSSQTQPPTGSQKKVANLSIEKANSIRDRNSYKELLMRIVPGLYKSNDDDRDRQHLAQLAQARGASNKSQKVVARICLDEDDDEQKDFIDLSKDDEQMLSACQKVQSSYTKETEKKWELPPVVPINSLKDRLETTPKLKPGWLDRFSNSYREKSEHNKQAIIEASESVRKASQDTAAHETAFIDNFRNCMVFHEPIVLDESEEEEEEEFPEFTDEQRSLIKRAIYRGPQDEILISKFNMNITRRDILTLVGDTWLNDEVINFYMNLLMERSETRSSEGLPRVYAMNTFFIPRLLQGGHSAVRRWTRKVDIFAHDVIPVPVHVGQVHWCMAIIHMKKKTIKYYDSMGTPNPRLLNALEDYLREESLDKRREPFDTSKFVKESVGSAPRQMNGSDCGVFSCMFAEYITRNREITFSQQHMPYFRQKMVLEIVQGKLVL